MVVLSFLRVERLFILCDLLSGGGAGEEGEEEGGKEAGAPLGWGAVFKAGSLSGGIRGLGSSSLLLSCEIGAESAVGTFGVVWVLGALRWGAFCL